MLLREYSIRIQYFWDEFYEKFMFCFCFADLNLTPECAPSVLITFINMMLFKRKEPKPTDRCSQYMYGNQVGVRLSHTGRCIQDCTHEKPTMVRVQDATLFHILCVKPVLWNNAKVLFRK